MFIVFKLIRKKKLKLKFSLKKSVKFTILKFKGNKLVVCIRFFRVNENVY